jgi:hypothetical protein
MIVNCKIYCLLGGLLIPPTWFSLKLPSEGIVLDLDSFNRLNLASSGFWKVKIYFKVVKLGNKKYLIIIIIIIIDWAEIRESKYLIWFWGIDSWTKRH